MKHKFSFHRLLHNNRLMMVVSLFLAVVIWASVTYRPSNIKERALTVNVTLDLTDTYADTIGLCILDKTSYDVTVAVKGKWSVISGLSANDINVRADYSNLKKAGNQRVSFTASYNSEVTDYDIVSVSPASINVNCDYWEKNLSYKVTPDLSQVSVSDTDRYQLGDAVVDPTQLPDGTVRLEGPRSVTNRITSIVARVEDKVSLSDVAVLPARLVALDENDNEVDISSCKLIDLASDTVNVTVPVWVSKLVEFTYTVKNLPGLFTAADKAISIAPASLVLLGPPDEVDEVAGTLANLGTVDFDNLLPENAEITVPLNIPSNCTVLDDVKEVTLKLDIASLRTRTMSLLLGPSQGNVVFQNLPAGLTATLPQQTISEIVLVGKNYKLSGVTAKKLEVVVDMAKAVKGAGRYEARVRVKGENGIWTYYGSTAHAFSVYVTVT